MKTSEIRVALSIFVSAPFRADCMLRFCLMTGALTYVIPALSPVEVNVCFSFNIYLNKLLPESLTQALFLWNPF